MRPYGPWEFRQLRKLYAFLDDDSGATAIEYSLMVAGIAMVIIAAVNSVGSAVNSKFDYIASQLK